MGSPSCSARPRLVTRADEPEQAAQVCRTVLEHREQGAELKAVVLSARVITATCSLERPVNIPFVKYGGLKFSRQRTSRTPGCPQR